MRFRCWLCNRWTPLRLVRWLAHRIDGDTLGYVACCPACPAPTR
jgi:hypothetical protein